MAERIEAEITLNFRDFSAGVDSVVRDSQRLDQGVGKGLSSAEQKAKITFAEFSKAARVAGLEYQDFAKKVTSAAQSISLGDLEKRFSGLAQKGAAAFGSVLEAGGNFQEGLLRINTIAGLSQEELAGLGDQLKNVGREIGVSATPTQTLASYYDVLSSGFTKTADATAVLSASLKLATGGQAEAAEVTRALTGVLNAYGDGSEKAQLRADQFFQTVNLGVTTIPELSKSLGLVTSTAASAGVSFEELSAAIATATLRGQTTSSAIEGIRGVIGSLISPTAGASKEFDRLGITVNATTLQQKGLLATLQEIQTASGGQVDSINKIIEGQVGLATALAISKDGGLAFSQNLEKIAGAAGASDKALGQVNKGVNESSKAFASSVERLKISAAEAALPIQKTLLEALTGVVDVLDKTPGPVKTAALALTGLGTAFAFAAGGILSLNIALPTAIGYATALGARALPLAIAGVNLLTARLTLQNVQLGLSSLGMAATTRATALFAAAQSGAATGMGVIVGAIGGVTLGFAAVAASVGIAIAAYTKLQEEANAANDAIIKSEDLRNNGRAAKGNVSLSNTEIFSSSAQDLAKRGVTTDDITNRIIAQERAAEQAREQQNSEQEKKAKERIARLRVLRTELSQELEKLDAESKKPPVLKQQTSAKEDAKTKREAEKVRSESVKDDVQEVENSKRTGEQKIAQLREIINEHRLTGAERRAIEDKIFALEKANDTERKKMAEEQRKESVADAIQDVENSKRSTQEKIDGLKLILTQYKASAAERRSIEDKIFALEKKDSAEQAKAKKAEERKAAKEKRDAAKAEKVEDKTKTDTLTGDRDSIKTESELGKKRLEILQELATVGAASQFELRQAIDQTLQLRLKEIEAERALAIQQATTAGEVASAEKRAGVAKVEAQNEAKRAIEKTTDAMKAQKKESSGATSLNLGGNPYSLSEFVSQSQGFLDINGADKKKADPKEIARQRNVLAAINGAPTPSEARKSVASQPVTSAISEAIKTSLSTLNVAVQLFDSSGTKIPSQVKKAEVGGKNSSISQLTRSM